MGRLKKTILILTAFGILALVLLGALELALPRLVNLDTVRQAALSAIQTHVDCEASFETMDVSLLPRPHVTAHKLLLIRQGGFTASVKAARVTVDALPLFRGQLRVSKVHLKDPKLTVFDRPGSSGAAPTAERNREELTYTGVRRGFVAFLAPAVTFPKGLTVTADDGTLEHHLAGDLVVRFEHVSARMDRRGTEVRLAYSCRSNLWRSVTSEGFFDLETFKGRSHTRIDGLDPNVLSRILDPEYPISFPQHEVNLSVQIVSAGPADLDLSFQASVPKLAIRMREQTTLVSGANLDGGIALRSDGFKITLGSLKLREPALATNGSLFFDPRTSRVTVDLHGSDVDAGAVRECMLTLAGNRRGVIKTFEVVRGGHVPAIRVQVQDKTLEELKELENVTITGSMVDGKLYIEPADLEVEGAAGDAVIENGILEGRNLQARTGATTGRDGSLTLALGKDAKGDGPFHLDIDVDADLSRLPAVLLHAVKDQAFLQELNRMSEIRGRAAGRLILGETIKEVKTRVDAREFSLQGKYQRVPFPIEIQGASLALADKSITIGGLQGTLSGSSWSPLDIAVDWGPSSRIAIQSSTAAKISVDQIFQWVTSYERVKRGLRDIQTLKGVIALESAQLEGPLYQPAKWKYEVKGSYSQGTLESPFFPAPVTIRSAKLTGAPGILTLSDCQASLLDASVSMTAILKTQGQGQGGLAATDLTFSESAVGPKVTQWVSDLIKLPLEFRPRPPLSLSKSRFFWERDGRVSFSGHLTQPGGVEAAIEFLHGKDQWALNRLAVKDQLSNAVLKVTVRERDLDLAFQGNLDGKTLDGLLEKNDLLRGGVAGDLRINVFVEDPVKSTATGVLDLNGFHSLWKFKAPVTIDQAKLEALGNRLSIQSADVVYEGNKLHLAGNLSFAPHGMSMDMAVSSDAVVWKTGESTEADRPKESGPGSSPQAPAAGYLHPKFMGLALTGLVNVSFDRLEYGKYTFSPFKAAVHLQPGQVRVEASEAKLCGISLPGELVVEQGKVSLVARPTSVNEPLEPSIVCLGGKKAIIDGTFNLTGELRAEGAREDLLKSLRGNLELNAKEGRIYRFDLVSKIVSVINVTELFRGQLPDLVNQGCAYDSIKAKATIKEGKLSLEETVVDGRCMKLVWSGTVDFPNRKLDLVVLLAPLRTFEKIIGYVPLIGSIFDGLISVPVRVSGDLSDPSIVPMSPTAVGSKIVGMMKQVLQAPFKVVSPLF